MQVETNCFILFSIYLGPIRLITRLPANFSSIMHMYREFLFLQQFVKPMEKPIAKFTRILGKLQLLGTSLSPFYV